MATMYGLLDRKDGPTAYYIATVWIDTGGWDITRQIVRLRACGPADFEADVRALWPQKALTFGPVSRSKVQG